MTTFRITLLGGFLATVDGRAVAPKAWSQRKPAALVKLLALAPGHRLRRERVMDALIARHGRGASSAYDGKGICYIEFGHNRVARVEVTFRSGERPNGQFDEPSELLLQVKAEFGTNRVRRWFRRDWTSH